jgi:hypothetical protein
MFNLQKISISWHYPFNILGYTVNVWQTVRWLIKRANPPNYRNKNHSSGISGRDWLDFLRVGGRGGVYQSPPPPTLPLGYNTTSPTNHQLPLLTGNGSERRGTCFRYTSTIHMWVVNTDWTMTYTSYLALVQNTHYDYCTRIDTNYILVYLG